TAPDGQLIEHSFQGTLQANYGLYNQFVVGIDIPIDLMSGSGQVTANGQPLFPGRWDPNKLDFQGIGYLAAHGKWRALHVEHGFGLALGLQIAEGLAGSADNAAAD